MELIKCNGCHKKFTEEGYAMNRHNIRLKTCLECKDRRKKNKEEITGSDPNSNLMRMILDHSECSDNYTVAREEWSLHRIEYDDDYDNCICGHNIKERCYIINDVNGHILLVGNICVKRFINREEGDRAIAMYNALKAIKKNILTRSKMTELISDAFTRKYINDWEYKFLATLSGTKTKLTDKQESKLRDVNSKIMNAYKKVKDDEIDEEPK
jgi:hypothetical protein